MTDPSHTSWRKSSRSGGGNNCVEITEVKRSVLVRDSKNPDGGRLAFTATEWAAFATRLKSGEYVL